MRPSMRTISIGFSTAKRWNPLSALIKYWWGTPYSHVYLRWDTPWGFEEILEASGTSVHMINDVRWEKKNEVIDEFEFIMTKEDFNRTMSLLRPLCGIPYGWKQAGGMFLRELFHLKKNPFQDSNRTIICCEIAYIFFHEILKFNIRISQDDITPKDIYKIINGNL